jgi:hypothetical protein
MKQEKEMIDALKTLFENDVVSTEIRDQIEEAWTPLSPRYVRRN